MPWVASEACWRKTESPAILQMSMGIVRRWPGRGVGWGVSYGGCGGERFLRVRGRGCLQANMVFMMGMYWCARSPETERIRMRGFRTGGCVEVGSEEVAARSGSGFVLEDVGVERARDCLLV